MVGGNIAASPSFSRRTGGVAAAYGASIGLLLMGEINLAHHISARDFGVYGVVKQAIPLVAALGLMGYDQALTRESAAAGRSARFDTRQGLLATRTCALAAALGAYLVWGLGTPILAAVALALAATCLTISNLVSGVMRATGHSFSAAIGQQGYRLLSGLVFLSIPATLSGVGPVWVTAAAAAMVSAGCLVWSYRIANPWVLSHSTQRLLTRLGYAYAFGMLGMTAADWLDQALVAQFAGLAESGRYAQTKLISVYPLLSLGSILGFVALPMVAARRSTMSTRVFRRWWRFALIATSVVLILGAPISVVAARNLLPTTMDMSSTLILVGVGALRLLYVLPSAVLGALGTPQQLAISGVVSLIGVAAQVLATLSLAPLGWTTAAAIGLLLFTVIRVLSSTLLCFQSLRKLGDLPDAGDEGGST